MDMWLKKTKEEKHEKNCNRRIWLRTTKDRETLIKKFSYQLSGLIQMEKVSFTHMKVAVNVVLNFSIITTLFQYIFLCLQVCICHLCPQTWHITSRVDGIEPKVVLDVIVQKVISPQAKSDKKRKKVSGVTSMVFKPFQQLLSTLNMAKVLRPLYENLTSRPGFLRIWPDEDEDVEMTESKFGLVPKGSVLAYQQTLPASIPNPDPNICS